MHNPLVRPPGFWRAGAPLEPWECEQVDAHQAANVNGDDGESFDAETIIVLGGAGMTVSASFRASQVQRCTLHPSFAVEFPTRTKSRFQHLERGTCEDQDNWVLVAGKSFRPNWYQRTTSTLQKVWIPLIVPIGSTITEIRATFGFFAPAHAAWPPASFPKLSYSHDNYDDITPAVASTSTDAPANQAAYEAVHTLTRTVSVGGTVLPNHRYFARFEGESGVNSEPGLRLLAIRTTVTMTSLDEWIAS